MCNQSPRDVNGLFRGDALWFLGQDEFVQVSYFVQPLFPQPQSLTAALGISKGQICWILAMTLTHTSILSFSWFQTLPTAWDLRAKKRSSA